MKYFIPLLLVFFLLPVLARADQLAPGQKAPPEKDKPALNLPEGWASGAAYFHMKEDPHKSAARGNPISQDLLGEMYEGGGTEKQDYAKAIKWYSKAAAQGIQHSQAALAHLYSDGHGVTPDYAESYFWYMVSDRSLQRTIEHLTPSQRAVAEKRVAEWKKAHPAPTTDAPHSPEPIFFDVSQEHPTAKHQ